MGRAGDIMKEFFYLNMESIPYRLNYIQGAATIRKWQIRVKQKGKCNAQHIYLLPTVITVFF